MPPSQSGPLLTAIDDICEQFEDRQQAGALPRLEDFLPADWPPGDRAQLLHFLLQVELEYRRRRGESFTADEYRARFADCPDVVAGVFSTATGTALPEAFGPYRVVSRIGAGGMGTVYKAFQPRLNRFVAVKALPAASLADASARRRFDREMEAIGKIAHPNLVAAFDAGQSGETCYLVMELVEGFSLTEIARRIGPLSVADACELIRQASLGLAQVHRMGLIHRDIKPGNLMLGPTGQVKVLDLGLALLQERPADERELTHNGQMMGTLDYMPPEQCIDSHRVDRRADIYALGATLFKLLTGRAPFAHGAPSTQVGRLSAKLRETSPPLQRFRPDAPPALAHLVARMLEPDPARRVATAEEVVEQIEPFCRTADLDRLLAEAGSERSGEESTDTATNEHTWRESALGVEPASAGQWPWSWLAGSLLLVGLILAATIFYLPTRHGTLRVEINDPQIVATIAGDEITLRQADRGRDLTLSPGKRSLRVQRGDFRFETDRFELRRGDTVTLRVELLDGQIVVRDDRSELGRRSLAPPPAALPPTPAPATPPKTTASLPLPALPYSLPVVPKPAPGASERDLAQYLTKLTQLDSAITDTGNYTDPQLRIVGIHRVFELITDFHLAPLASLRHLEKLELNSRRVTDKGFAYFRDNPGLKQLNLTYSNISGAGAAQLAHYPDLEFLQPPWQDGDAWLAAAPRLPKLKQLFAYRTDITDDGLKPLVGMKQLRILWIHECRQLTPKIVPLLERMQQLEVLNISMVNGVDDDEAAVDRLRKALPKARVN